MNHAQPVFAVTESVTSISEVWFLRALESVGLILLAEMTLLFRVSQRQRSKSSCSTVVQ